MSFSAFLHDFRYGLIFSWAAALTHSTSWFSSCRRSKKVPDGAELFIPLLLHEAEMYEDHLILRIDFHTWTVPTFPFRLNGNCAESLCILCRLAEWKQKQLHVAKKRKTTKKMSHLNYEEIRTCVGWHSLYVATLAAGVALERWKKRP